jgi:hypothetical protein
MRRYLFLPLFVGVMAASASAKEIHLEACDVLPVVEVSISGVKFLFLLDTAAMSFLNSKSFASGPELKIPVTSWNGTTQTTGQQVTISDLAVGGRHLRNLRLPAVDLSAMGRACGRMLDGVLGIDLLHALGASLEFDAVSARLLVRSEDAHAQQVEFDQQFAACELALSRGDDSGTTSCLDQDVVLATLDANIYGRDAVLDFLRRAYLVRDRSTQLFITICRHHILGEGMWVEYELHVAAPDRVVVQRGSALWQQTNGQWRALYLNHSNPLRNESRVPSN